RFSPPPYRAGSYARNDKQCGHYREVRSFREAYTQLFNQITPSQSFPALRTRSSIPPRVITACLAKTLSAGLAPGRMTGRTDFLSGCNVLGARCTWHSGRLTHTRGGGTKPIGVLTGSWP